MDIFRQKSIILAPMAGITETVFRQLCREHGADIVVSEMVSAEGIKYRSANTLSLLKFRASERPIGIQLFGADPNSLADAARFVQDYCNPDFIDLNAGCPVPKVVGKNGGSALLKDRKLFEGILKEMVKAVSIPVTVKIRSGWFKYEWVDVELARVAEQCGVSAITLHPRSKTMVFAGTAFRERIGEVKRAVSVPVVGNGDICSGEDALAMLSETGCDSVMIGRGSYGNPWIFEQARACIKNRAITLPHRREKEEVVLNHLKKYAQEHGELRASKEMKKHVAWYLRGNVGASTMRNRVFRSSSISELCELVKEAYSEQGD
ncbi:tRNA dihydrouridine synthase DusB [Chitinispirillales bacterium ANBcel5]|uniref:tRNA dihydrouridine synthase DusB n=1 Tax=Cellulosispirillum alkaliphilum TaxID=3039283 RepID=UPI002A4FF230|nr:tRNA dihydrouridine synthase DusB [Chitinispirillales bacterium ANBcel5]